VAEDLCLELAGLNRCCFDPSSQAAQDKDRRELIGCA
jgi:hypothetical protein